MENWKKIRTFNTSYEAELRKEILKNNNISSVVLASQDSSFLIGSFDLYVEEEDLEAAGIIIEEFRGWTKVNSFCILEPVEIVKEFLSKEGYEVLFTKNVQFDEYELYVQNEVADEAKMAIDTMKPWVLLDSFETAKQAAYRVEQLVPYKISCIVIKRRVSSKHLINIDVMVSPSNYKNALDVISEMKNWHFIIEFETKREAFLNQKMLEREGINVLTKNVHQADNKDVLKKIKHYVRLKDIERSKELIDENKEWVRFSSFHKLYEVEMIREILKQNNINSVFINEKDSMFLLGEMVVYVEKGKIEEAQEYLKSWSEALQNKEELEVQE